MRKIGVCTALLLLLCAHSYAQEVPKYELFAGLSYLRGEGASEPLQTNRYATMYGWHASAVRNINGWSGLVADASGHYRAESRDFLINNRRFSVDSGKNMHLFLFGPRFSLRKYERITPFVQALAGLAYGRTSTTRTFAPDPAIKRSNSELAFATGAGFGVDVSLTDETSFRLVQADYLFTDFDERRDVAKSRHNVRLSTEVNLKFARINITP